MGTDSDTKIILLMTAACAAIAITVFGLAADPVSGLRAALAATARTSLLLFAVAFASSSIAILIHRPWTRWLLRHRRAIGLSFAMSHAIHAVAILALAAVSPEIFRTLTNPVSIVAGSSCYLVITAMAVTSLKPIRSRMSTLAWRRLHWYGGYVIFIFFVVNFGKRIPAHGGYAVALIVLAGVLLLRVAAAKRIAKAKAAARNTVISETATV